MKAPSCKQILATGLMFLFLSLFQINLPQNAALSKPLYDPNALINYSASAQLASRVGDIVTIKIAESLISKRKRTDKVDKKFSLAAPITSIAKSWLELINEMGLSGQSKSDVTRNKDIDDTLKGVITAQVTEVLPNGNLVVEGKKQVAVGNDNQMIALKGIVRPYDLDAFNSVDSTKVANLEVHTKDKSKSGGILQKILKFLF